MAWVKIPVDHHPLFRAALPKDPRISTIQMFGGVAALVNGNMFGALFGRSAIAKLGGADLAEALALDGAEPFDPMGKGRVMHHTVLLPEDVLHDPAELRGWMRRAFTYTATLPPKKKKRNSAAANRPAGARRPATVKKSAGARRPARAR